MRSLSNPNFVMGLCMGIMISHESISKKPLTENQAAEEVGYTGKNKSVKFFEYCVAGKNPERKQLIKPIMTGETRKLHNIERPIRKYDYQDIVKLREYLKMNVNARR